MPKYTSFELLRRFMNDRDEGAFLQLVEKHVDLVFSVAVRQLKNRHWAEEMTQNVFVELIKSGPNLTEDTVLPAWLYQVTYRRCIDAIRSESRRRVREKIAVELRDMNAQNDVWMEIEPLVEEALATLNQKDRAAVILRFFENKSLKKVGNELGVSEDAAQKRVSRALQRLSQFFERREVETSAIGLSSVLSSYGVQAAPLGLAAATLKTSSSALTGLYLTGFFSSNQIITMTTLQKIAVTTAVTIGIGTGVYQNHQAKRLEEAFNQLKSENSTSMAALKDELEKERKTSGERHQELLNLQEEFSELEQLYSAALEGESPNGNSQSVHLEPMESQVDQKQIQAHIEQSHTIPKELWGFAGFDTAEDAFLTTVWSASQGNYETYLESLNEEGKRRTKEMFNGKSPSEIEDAMRQMIEPLKVIRLDRIKERTENEVSFTVRAEEVDDGESRHRSEAVLTFEKIDGKWTSDGLF